MIRELPQITESVFQGLVQEGNLGRVKIILGSLIILREVAAFFWLKYIYFLNIM